MTKLKLFGTTVLLVLLTGCSVCENFCNFTDTNKVQTVGKYIYKNLYKTNGLQLIGYQYTEANITVKIPLTDSTSINVNDKIRPTEFSKEDKMLWNKISGNVQVQVNNSRTVRIGLINLHTVDDWEDFNEYKQTHSGIGICIVFRF